uniref:HSA domain-containing protein n=1 Tax=Setaria italica TaxID=4555 RepID=K3YZU7_SETIT
MASKGPRSKLDHETRARRQKEFDSERKWKLSMAKKIAQRANKSIVDQATKGERKQKEEEHRMRKVALNISKDVKKFWIKIEKLHQLELEERKKKALDKQLDFLLGQTERYSTMLAENLVDMPYPQKLENGTLQTNQSSQTEEVAEENENAAIPDDPDNMEVDGDYESSLDEEPEDDEHTIDEDEAQITEAERNEELAALQGKSNGNISSIDEQEDKDYVAADEGKDDEATLSEEEELAKKEVPDHLEEVISAINT